MKTSATGRLMKSLLVISLALFLIGEIFRIQHYPYGKLLVIIGLGSYLILSQLEITRLKKIIADSDKQKS